MSGFIRIFFLERRRDLWQANCKSTEECRKKRRRQLTESLERWQSFLATACAEFDVWNNTMHRYVRRGSKDIALIDTSGDRERLRYVFDVSDTGTRPNSRSLNLCVNVNEKVYQSLAKKFTTPLTN